MDKSSVTVRLIHEAADSESTVFLDSIYANNLIPAEKKPFLIDLSRSTGPFMAVDDGDFVLDVASQIASLGLGFNPGALFGAAQYLESWTGRTDTGTIQAVRRAFHELLNRSLDWQDFHLHLCNSGAEAIEIALGACFERRTHRKAKRVLAFENSFHGRTMVALASTWNATKREPFAWPGYETRFIKYPELPLDDIQGPPIPDGWQRLWSAATRIDFESQLAQWQLDFDDDSLFQSELDTLLSVRQELASGEIFAVLIEPMQCEGGDRYSSARFHNGLINLARAFAVPLVYDEIQTGFGLGGNFFWHEKFSLTDGRVRRLAPDFVVLAKKAQVGAVLSHAPINYPEQYNASSLVRGYIQASLIDQFQSEIQQIEQQCRKQLENIIARYPDWLARPRASGLSFAFDFKNAEDLQRLVSQRFTHGILFYPAGQRSARFRLNLSFRQPLIDLAWQQIDTALAATFGDSREPTPPSVECTDPQSYVQFHQQLLNRKLDRLNGRRHSSDHSVKELIIGALEHAGANVDELAVTFLDSQNYSNYRDEIRQLQIEIYEPLRQTPIAKFDALIQSRNHLAIVVTERNKIVAMAFAAPPVNFPAERGLRGDAHFNDPQTVYMLDLTVVPKYRGKMGRVMKQAMCLLADERGITGIQGRNRDRLARSMWAINLSLGSYCTRILEDDYLDDEPHRDCLMYRCPIHWQSSPVNLSNGMSQPLDEAELTAEFFQQNMASLVNKLTLSNFVTRTYLNQLRSVFDLLPAPMRHGYSASGISESVDKIAKSIWLKRQPRTRLVTIEGSYFGSGSFLARSLSGIGEQYFPVTFLPRPDSNSNNEWRESLGELLSRNDVLAVFIEPLGWRNGRKLSVSCLKEIRGQCRQYDTPLVFHDTAGQAFRYSTEAFLPSATDSISPDAGIIGLGGQMAVCFMVEDYFVEQPLTMISTWDGDVFSLAQYHWAKSKIMADVDRYLSTMQTFHEVLVRRLAENGVSTKGIENGIGWFRGPLESDLAEMFDRNENGCFLSCPNYGQMQKFIKRFSSID